MLGLLFLTSQTIAGMTRESITGIPQNAIVVTLNSGPAWYKSGQTQDIYLDAEILNRHVANNSTLALASTELFIGFQKAIHAQWLGQVGIAVSKPSHATMSGDIWQDADPDFNNFYDHYYISHIQATVKGKLLSLVLGPTWQPYFSVTLGAASNKAFGYQSTTKLFQAIPPPDFLENTVTAFTYATSVGIQRMLNAQWALGAAYEFADWGKSSLSPANGQISSSAPSMSHLYTNQFQLNLTYFVVD